ncbi:MAG: hypothetical protein ACRBDL_11810 [Alphaproteobacteria bacterium]
MKRALFLTVCLCAFFPLIACQAEEPTEGQKKNIAEMERLDKLRAGGKCVDESIIVEIDGVRLKVPRYTDVTFKDGSHIGKHELQYRCDLQALKNVASILRFPTLGVAEFKLFEKRYDKILEDHSIQPKTDGYLLFDNGLRQLNSNKYVYDMPHRSGSTEDANLGLLVCNKDPIKENTKSIPIGSCYVHSFHSAGLSIWYQFHIELWEHFFRVDSEKRQLLESYILERTE